MWRAVVASPQLVGLQPNPRHMLYSQDIIYNTDRYISVSLFSLVPAVS